VKTLTLIDGSNLLAELGKQPQFNVNIRAVTHDFDAIVLGHYVVHKAISNAYLSGAYNRYRTQWIASVAGTDEIRLEVRERLRAHGLDSNIFPARGKREKQVDAAVIRELLYGASVKAFDCCILVAGDRDYLDVVKDVKRFGIVVFVSFFESSIDRELKLEADRFLPIDAGPHNEHQTMLDNLTAKYGRYR
jgi:uncharacterized LabA/DUF88 family protein